MENKSLGIIEVVGLTVAIQALDCALKSANVKFLKMEKVGSGIITVMITGDIAAVKSATEASRIACEKLGNIRAINVIARPVSDVYKMLDYKNPIHKEKVIINEVPGDTHSTNQNKAVIKENSIEVNNKAELKNSSNSFDNMSVSELRKLARQLKLTNITKPEIKFAKRKQLIEKISEFRKDN